MNEYLKKAIEIMGAIERLAAEKETEAMSFAASYALAAAAIAQAEAAQWQAQTGVRQALAAERQAEALERIDLQLARVATVLNELMLSKTEAPDWNEGDWNEDGEE